MISPRIGHIGLLTVCLVSVTTPAMAANLGYSLEFSGQDLNQPMLKLTNTAMTESIIGFTLRLEQTEYNFDSYLVGPTSIGVEQIVNGLDTNIGGGLRADEISLDFTGLTPGQFISGIFDVDQDSINTLEDYRQILFDLNGSDASNNALVTVLFSSGNFLSSRLPDFAETDSNVYTFNQQQSLAAIPTPALLPGLMGFGLSLFRKKCQSQTPPAKPVA